MHPLVEKLCQGDIRAAARALTVVESDDENRRQLLESLYPMTGRAHIIGFTGPPGAGKSTLVDAMIGFLRQRSLKVGVLAVDPSSPFSGGALLGDRIRMIRHSEDSGVFIRSVGTRGDLGGLSAATGDMVHVLDAFGCDVIFLETVGVGQSELDVLTRADSVVLVLTPGTGDHIQAAKAGIMEIADIFVVNKDDLPGSDTLIREIQWMLHEKRQFRENWQPPVLRTQAVAEQGIEELWKMLVGHRQHLASSGFGEKRRCQRLEVDVERLLQLKFRNYLQYQVFSSQKWRELLQSNVRDPYQAAEMIQEHFPGLAL